MPSSTPLSHSFSFVAMFQQGLDFQHTTAKLLAETMTAFVSLAKWQERIAASAGKMIRASQENADEASDYINRGADSKRQLVATALRPGANPIELWAITATVVCANMEAVWRTGMRAVETSAGVALLA